MVLTGLLPKEAGSIEGVIDTGVVVIAHFDNPARKAAFRFLKKVLAWESRLPRCRGDRGFQSVNQDSGD